MSKQNLILSALVALSLFAVSRIQAAPNTAETLAIVKAPITLGFSIVDSYKTLHAMKIACSAHTVDQHDPSLIRRHDVGIMLSWLDSDVDISRAE